MSAEPDEGESPTLAELRERTRALNRRPRVGYFDDHPPRDAYMPAEEAPNDDD